MIISDVISIAHMITNVDGDNTPIEITFKSNLNDNKQESSVIVPGEATIVLMGGDMVKIHI